MTRSRLPLQIACLTHPGKVRSHNEDTYLVNVASGFAILTDGMGGYNAGEVASEMAAGYLGVALNRGLPHCAAPARLLRRAIEQINTVIRDAAQTQPDCAGMGTTLVAAVFQPGRVTVSHVGDSRMYRLRGDCFEPITRDHSLLQEQIDCGLVSKEEARRSQHRNLVTRALGIEPMVEVDVADHATMPGDLYLLCSDGLNDMVADEDIVSVLRVGAGDLSAAAQQLIQMANDNGGRDNVTVILARVLAEPLERRVMARLAGWIKQQERPHKGAPQAAVAAPYLRGE